jgi:uncharacterized delta-60 repeat protein
MGIAAYALGPSKGTDLVSIDTVSSDSCRRNIWRRSLSGLLLLLAVWGVLLGRIWPQTQEEEPPDSGPIREPIFVIDDRVAAVALQNDGKLVVAGESDRSFAVARYLPDGSLDPGFGSDGKVVVTQVGAAETSFEGELSALALQADGKIVVVGRTWQQYSNDIAVVRFNADGTLDASFGDGGKVTTNFPDSVPPTHSAPGPTSGYGLRSQDPTNSPGPPPSSRLTYGEYGYDEASAVGIQADGKLVVGGTSLVRYNPDGTLDTSFGSGGRVTTKVHALAVQRDGKIVVVGAAGAFAVARYTSDGTLDASFGAGGTVTTKFGKVDEAESVALQADGKLVVVGRSFNGRSVGLAMARYNPDGTLDTSFGRGGTVTSDSCAYQVEERFANSIGTGGLPGSWGGILQADGKIVVRGSPMTALCPASMLLRYNPDGSQDGTFGKGGRVTTARSREDGALSNPTIQGDGKIVVGGTSGRGFALARYNPDGNLDPSFGAGGKVMTQVGTGHMVQ